MTLQTWIPKKSDNSSINNHKTLKYLSEVFGVSLKDLIEWKEGRKTLQKILNLSPSEDSTITNFIVPLLKNILNYTTQEIDIKPYLHINYGRKVVKKGGQSDVVVRKSKRPVFVIEAKAYGHPLQTNDEDAEGQAYDYTRANELKPRAWFYITSNVRELHIYDSDTRKELLFIKEEELDDKLPQLTSLLHKDKISAPNEKKMLEVQTVFRTPITNKKEFERLLFKCQDYMREAKEAKTGKTAFDEMNKLLFIKIFEDRKERNGEENRFTAYKILTEGENYIKGTLFEDIKKFYKKKGTPIFNENEKINLDTTTVNLIVEKLQYKFFVDEDGKVFEPIGDVYENFVSTIFRGENGQYFTPRPVVDFMIKMTGIKWGEDGMKICDPACGSGGFLLYVFSKLDDDLKKEFMDKELNFKSKTSEEMYKECKYQLCNELLVGFDNEDSIAKTAMMNMSVHGDGSIGIYFGNSLITRETGDILKQNSFDCVLTNPPFSVSVKENSLIDINGMDALNDYDLAHKYIYNKDKNEFKKIEGERGLKNQDSKILFIERCYQLLKDKKYLGIVIDDGVLNNPSLSYVRNWIFGHFIVKAVISLPFEVFKERGATNRTSVLILQKKTDNMIQGDVFMAIPEHAGELYGKLGQRLSNDLEEVYNEWKDYKNDKKTQSKFSFIVKKENLENYWNEKEKIYYNRIDPKYYNPEFRKLIQKIENNENSKEIDEVVDFIEDICSGDDINSFGSKYIKKITKDGKIEVDIMDGVNDPKGEENRIFRAGDLVASRINIKSGMIAFVPDDVDEIRATPEYYKFVPKVDEKGNPLILKEYLYIVLTSRPMQLIMDAVSTGQYMRLKDWELGKIKIPVPDIKVQKKIVDKCVEEREIANKLKLDSLDKIGILDSKVENMIVEGKFI